MRKNMTTNIRNIFVISFILSYNWGVAQNSSNLVNTESIVYINEVSSLDELFSKFKGHNIYVDFWASWCKPCLDELKQQPDLETYFKSKDVIRLYIAIEQLETDPTRQLNSIEKWKELVEKHNLVGYNYFSQLRSPFFSGITEKIMKGKISLPRFAIIDKNGIILDRDAKRPSDLDKLIKQISKYVENE